jgi:hypothetical protein
MLFWRWIAVGSAILAAFLFVSASILTLESGTYLLWILSVSTADP